MAIGHNVFPAQGQDMDVDESLIPSQKATFIKNLTDSVNHNEGAGKEGANVWAKTPLQSNQAYVNTIMPLGTNVTIGQHEDKERNNLYVFVWNSLANHLIYRVRGADGVCEKIYQGSCLNFQLDPAHYISPGRVTVHVTTRPDASGELEYITYLTFTDNYNEVRFICVEDSIATNGFDASLPYFQTGGSSCDKCNLINLGVPMAPSVTVAPIPRTGENEEIKTDLLQNKGWQFRIRGLDRWGRPQEYGPISDMYLRSGGMCGTGNSGARCLKLTFDVGCPTIEKWEILVRTASGKSRGLSTATDWYIVDTIEKYNNCSGQVWYERSIRSSLNYNTETKTVEYTFCADKERIPVPVEDSNRLENPLPLTSSSVFPMNRSIGLARNKRRYAPMDCSELAKVKYNVVAPVEPSNCSSIKQRKVVIYGLIWNPYEDSVIRLREKNGSNVFGAADCYGRDNNPFEYEQVLPSGQEGIIGYMAGTNIHAISRQGRWNITDRTWEYTGINYTNPGGLLMALINRNYIPLQRWEFSLAPGKYVFRLSSHKSSPSDDYKRTSTRLIGQTRLSGLGSVIRETKELIIDVCEGDVEIIDEPLMIYDFTREGKGCAVVDRVSACEGYLYEDEVSRIPIEMARVENTTGNAVKCAYTDHNGYYFAATRAYGLEVKLYGYKNCQQNQFLGISSKTYDSGGALHRFNEIFVYKKETEYPARDRYTVKGKIVECGNPDIGISGALVVLTNGSHAYTNGKGEYSIIAHNTGDQNLRIENVIFSQRGTCQLIGCDTNSCNYCIPDKQVTSPSCSGQERSVTVETVSLRVKGVNEKGPTMGGRYGIGLVLEDWMGRQTYVQSNDDHYVSIPSLHETKIFKHSKIQYDLTGVQFDPWVRRVSFWVTENLELDDYLTWAIDRLEFVDNTGKVNNVSPSSIRLYYEGLAEYNKQKGFATTTSWQFLTADEQVEISDEIEFMVNGDGLIYEKMIRLQVQYDKDGRYVQVEYTDDLRGLLSGAQIRLIRPKKSNDKQFYYNVPPMIRVVNGVAQQLTGTIDLVDSYLQTRAIPVPVVKKNGETSVTENELRTYAYPFEHHSPSDMWGDHCWNKGRVSVKNPEEKPQLMKMEIAVSGAITSTGTMNYLGYFTEKKTFVFDEQEWGGISICLSEVNMLLVICEQDNFVVGFDDQRVYVTAAGQVNARGGNEGFGRPERKAGSNFGCQLRDINTIRKRNGIVAFLDAAKAALIMHNYGQAIDISAAAGMKGWLSSKVKSVADANISIGRDKYFHAGFDPKNGWLYYLTDSYVEAGEGDYINNLLQAQYSQSETIQVDMAQQICKGFVSFIPEYYGTLEGDKFGQQLISFKNGKAWYHHDVNTATPSYNNFYGVPVDMALEIVFNMDPKTRKTFYWTQLNCIGRRLFIDRVETSHGQHSRIMPKFWTYFKDYQVAAFLCDLNTRVDPNLQLETGSNKLTDGDTLNGSWMKVRIVGKQVDRDKYFELTNVTGYFVGEPNPPSE